MVTLNDIQQKFPSLLSLRPAAADMTTMRTLCADLLCDVPHGARTAMLDQLSTLRRASDLWRLRTVLFVVIARHHGEQAAKDRLLALDSKLLPLAPPGNGP